MNETILIDIKDGNVNIDSDCSQDSLMSAVVVLTASMKMNSTNSLDELLEIIKYGATKVIENENLKINKEDK